MYIFLEEKRPEIRKQKSGEGSAGGKLVSQPDAPVRADKQPANQTVIPTSQPVKPTGQSVDPNKQFISKADQAEGQVKLNTQTNLATEESTKSGSIEQTDKGVESCHEPVKPVFSSAKPHQDKVKSR